MLKYLSRWAPLVLIIGCCALWASTAAAEQSSSQVRSLQGGYLDAGGEHTCAILADASVRCWGLGAGGRLGYGSDANVSDPSAAGPVAIAGGQPRAVAAGLFHTCAIVQDASTRCWGFGSDGRLGNGDTADVPAAAAARPVDLGAGRRSLAISAGISHTCALLDDATVRCWGRGDDGRLGSGDERSVGDDEVPGSRPPVPLGRPAVAVAAGDYHACAILDTGALRCWGFGANGRLGDGVTDQPGQRPHRRLTPGPAVDLGAGRRAVALTAGSGHTCAVLDDGGVRCWGFNGDGQLGAGDNTTRHRPASHAVRLGGRAVAIAAAPGYISGVSTYVGGAHTCAVLDTGALRCWGFNGNGQLGIASSGPVGVDNHPEDVPAVDLGPGVQARAVTVGAAHTCALLSNSTVRCWGFDGDGRLGTDGGGTVRLGGTAPGAVAATTLALSPHSAQVPAGGVVNLQLAIGNAGIDPADVRLAVETSPGLVIEAADPASGTFDRATGTWRPGPLAASSRATLALRARAQGAGTAVLTAEVLSTSAFNPTTPNGGVGALAQAMVAISAPPPPPPPPPPPATTDSILPPPPTSQVPARTRGLSATYVRTPRAGVSRRLTVNGVLRLPAGANRAACAGTVRARATAGKRLIASRNAVLRWSAGVCRYRAVLPLAPAKVKRAKRVQLRVRFMGTPTLLARNAKAANLLVKAPPLPRSVTAKAQRTSRAGRTSTFALSGAVNLPRGAKPAACAGAIRVRATVGSKTVASRSVRVKRVRVGCRYTAKLAVSKAKVTPAKRVVVRVAYLGTPRLQARDAKAVAVRM